MGSIEMIMRSIDVSSFLLFEGSADSEDTNIDHHHQTIIIFKEEDIDNDDAESCISHSPEFDTGGYETAVEDWPDDVAGSSPTLDDQKWSGHEDQDEVVSGRRRRRGLGYFDGNEDRKKFKACLDSGFSEMEKNRLFWEACLTS